MNGIRLLLLSCLFAALPVFAADGVLSGTPYEGDANLDTSLPTDLAAELPELGDASQRVMSAQDEQRIAEQILREVAVSDQVLQDVEVVDYLETLGNRLVAASDSPQQKFHFFVVKDASINAFAMPGGVIGVHTGLFMASNSESEVAGVLGHEVGHVTQHHIARMLQKQKTDVFKNVAGIALALLVARANPQLAQGALTASSAASLQRQLDYTREHEREADRVGLTILQNAGFDPHGMPAFFRVLQRGSRLREGSAPSFLRTHPLTTERISDVENRVSQLPYKQVASSQDYYYIKAKLRAGYGLAQAAVEQFQSNIREKRYASEEAEQYGLALALLRNQDVAGTAKQVAWLTNHGAENAFIANLKARLAVAQDKPSEAGKLYAAGLKEYPKNRGLIYGYAEHFLASRQPAKMVALVKEKQPYYPDDPYLYQLLSKAYYMENKSLLRFQAQGEAYYRQYNLAKAVEQMDFAAKAQDGTFYQKSIVEARLKALERMLQSSKKEP